MAQQNLTIGTANAGGGESPFSAFTKIQANTTELYTSRVLKTTSTIDPLGTSHQVYQNVVGPGANDIALEILNIGYTGHGASDLIHGNNTGLVRINGRLNLIRNMAWDQANAKWLTPIQGATAYGSVCLEMGGERIWMHATPPGVDFSDVPHEIFGAGIGTDGETNNTIDTGYFSQSKGTIFARFNNTPYNPAATNNCWNDPTGIHPLIWVSSAHVKNTENELISLEGNGSGVFGGLTFRQSGGTLATRTAATTNSTMGSIFSKEFDGVAFQTTAAMDFISRGTVSSGNAGQEIRFRTSATNTAGMATRFAIGHDGKIMLYVPLRYDIPAITTIPDYTGNGYTPVLTSGTVAQIQPASTTNGGMIFQGFTVSGTNTATAMVFRGIQGHTSPTGANTQFVCMKHNGTTNFTAIAAGEIGFRFINHTTNLVTVLGSGNMGHLVDTPTAVVHIAASSTSRASLCLNPGAAPTSPVNGDMWIDSVAHTFHVRVNGVSRTVTLT